MAVIWSFKSLWRSFSRCGHNKRQSRIAQSGRGLTMRAVDRWVRAAFSDIFVALSFSRFDGESRPSHLPLTRAVSPQTSLQLIKDENHVRRTTNEKRYFCNQH